MYSVREKWCQVAPCTRPCSEYWWSFHCCPSEPWWRMTCEEKEEWAHTCHASETWAVLTYVFNPQTIIVHLHVHLGVVDEILQRISTRVVILELGVVGDGPDGWVQGSHHPADIHRLDVGEVGEDSRPRGSCGLRNYSGGSWLFKKWLKINSGQRLSAQHAAVMKSHQESGTAFSTFSLSTERIASICVTLSQEQSDSSRRKILLFLPSLLLPPPPPARPKTQLLFRFPKSALILFSWRRTSCVITSTIKSWIQDTLLMQHSPRNYFRRRFPLWWGSWTSSQEVSQSCPASPCRPHCPGCGSGSVSSRCIRCRSQGRFE